MIRRTVTLPDDLAAQIEAAVAAGAARNVSRFVQEAARRYLDALRGAALAREAARLDPDEELAIASRSSDRRSDGPPPGGQRRRSPWGRLG